MRLLSLGLSVCLLLAALGARAAEALAVAPELWDRPRSGGVMLEQPAVKQAVNAYLAQPGVRLIIHHAARQESLMQAEEMRAWLVALAVEAERIALHADLQPGEPLKVEVAASR